MDTSRSIPFVFTTNNPRQFFRFCLGRSEGPSAFHQCTVHGIRCSPGKWQMGGTTVELWWFSPEKFVRQWWTSPKGSNLCVGNCRPENGDGKQVLFFVATLAYKLSLNGLSHTSYTFSKRMMKHDTLFMIDCWGGFSMGFVTFHTTKVAMNLNDTFFNEAITGVGIKMQTSMR